MEGSSKRLGKKKKANRRHAQQGVTCCVIIIHTLFTWVNGYECSGKNATIKRAMMKKKRRKSMQTVVPTFNGAG